MGTTILLLASGVMGPPVSIERCTGIDVDLLFGTGLPLDNAGTYTSVSIVEGHTFLQEYGAVPLHIPQKLAIPPGSLRSFQASLNEVKTIPPISYFTRS